MKFVKKKINKKSNVYALEFILKTFFKVLVFCPFENLKKYFKNLNSLKFTLKKFIENPRFLVLEKLFKTT